MGSDRSEKEKQGGPLFFQKVTDAVEKGLENVEKGFDKGIQKITNHGNHKKKSSSRSSGESSEDHNDEEKEEDNLHNNNDDNTKKKKKFRMPPDATLQQMKVIAGRKLRGVSVHDYHQVAWSDKKPMYGPFLEKQGKNNVSVSEWESISSSDNINNDLVGEWCGETTRYTDKRIVTFSFMKQTIGQTLVEVKHTQLLGRNDGDQCIVQIKMEMKGFPYADCFVVHVRHVVSRVGDNDLSLQIGMHVEFLKSCMFEKKIRTNTGAETTKAQLALLEMILDGCAPYEKKLEGSAADDVSEDEDETLENVLTAKVQPRTTNVAARYQIKLPDPIFKALRFIMMGIVTIFRNWLQPYIQSELFDPFPPSSVDDALQSTRAGLKVLEEISLKSTTEGRKKVISREIALVRKSIDRIEELSTKV